MRFEDVARASALALVMVAGLAAAAPATGPHLAAVARIEPGQWQIKTVGSDAGPRLLCVSDPRVLIHYARHGAGCEATVMTDRPELGTLQYRCTGGGTGRTTFRVATPRAFDLDMQGFVDGMPYDESYEAHRLGACPR